MKPKPQSEERAQRARDHALSIYLSDPTLKDRLKVVAEKEGMKKSQWLRHHILPQLEKYIEERLNKIQGPTFKVQPPVRNLTIFERMKADAEKNLRNVRT